MANFYDPMSYLLNLACAEMAVSPDDAMEISKFEIRNPNEN